MSIEALWSIKFVGNSSEYSGGGVIVLESGRIYGGDSNFVFSGNCLIKDGEIEGTVKINRHSYGMEALIPGLEDWKMNFRGNITSNDSMQLVGIPDLPVHGKQIKIGVSCKRILDLP